MYFTKNDDFIPNRFKMIKWNMFNVHHFKMINFFFKSRDTIVSSWRQNKKIYFCARNLSFEIIMGKYFREKVSEKIQESKYRELLLFFSYYPT